MNYHTSDMRLIRQLLTTRDKDRQMLVSLLNEARLSFCSLPDSEDSEDKIQVSDCLLTVVLIPLPAVTERH